MKNIMPVILCGGFGERLWPLSRQHAPKQFAPLVGDKHLFAMCVERAVVIPGVKSITAIGNEDHRFLIAQSLAAATKDWSVLLEPVARNTAAAICAAAHMAMDAGDDDPVLIILPSDHHMPDTQGFTDTIAKAIEAAETGAWVTLGIEPDHASTQYGYITTKPGSEGPALTIEAFKEKPEQPEADQLVKQGAKWNAGIFIVKASVARQSFADLQPDIDAACSQAWQQRTTDNDFIRLDEKAFTQAPSLPVDIAIMEKQENALMVPFDNAWSDLGSWSAVAELSDRDEHGNAGAGDAHFLDSKNTFIRSNSRLTYAIGMTDTLIVDTPDALIVAAKDKAGKIREAVKQLKQAERPEVINHRYIARPWGGYESLATGPGYQVKRITVSPGAALSLQYHNHRAEHWVVVTGLARVTCGDKVFDLNPNQSTYIPLGEKHRLENPSDEPLEIIEVQSGDYLGEDDIIRLDDVYGRSGSNK